MVKEGKKLLITELGLMTVDMLTEYFKGLISIPFSAQMEAHLDEIAEHKTTKEAVLHSFYDPFAEDLKVAEEKIPHVEIPLEVSDVPCDKCGKMMVIREGRFGKFLACPGFPDCRNTKPILVKIGVKCPKCGGELIERKTKTGKIFYGCEKYPDCDFTTWDKPLNEACGKCGGMLVEHVERNGRKQKFCSNPECADARPVRPSAAKTTTATTTIKTAAKKTTTRKTAAKKTTTKAAAAKKGTKA